MSRLAGWLLLALTAALSAADFPNSTGYVNDFAGRLSEADRASLDRQLRDYESVTSNEVAIAIVNGLDGQPVDQYANGLFREWGIGKKDRNNGVLFLWAPTERKVRIEVGMGLEQQIPNSAAAEILATVTGYFRREDYAGGVHSGVDAILAKLGGGVPDTPPPSPPEPKNDALLLIPLVGVAGVMAVIVTLWRRSRKRELARSLPHDLEGATKALKDADQLSRNATSAVEVLRQEAPTAVWSDYADAVANAPTALTTLRAQLETIGAMPRERLGELARAHGAMRHWNERFSREWEWLAGAQSRLDSFRYCREQSQILLPRLRQLLDARRGEGRVVEAAAETYQQAVDASNTPPVNWLLVYDLLMDVQDCLAYADDPNSFRYTQRPRNWIAENAGSAALLFLMMQSQSQPAWGNTGMDMGSDGGSSFDSGGSGGGDSGGFGGGDTGGGGSSSDY